MVIDLIYQCEERIYLLWFQYCSLDEERCHHEYSLYMRRKMWWEQNVMNGFIGESNIKSYHSKGICKIEIK